MGHTKVLEFPTPEVLARINDDFRHTVFGPPASMKVRFSKTVEVMLREYRALYDYLLTEILLAEEFDSEERSSGDVRVGENQFHWWMEYRSKDLKKPGTKYGRILHVVHTSEKGNKAYVGNV